MPRMFRFAAVGGTFDLFHMGHETMILKAFEIADHVIIGLTSDEFAAKLSKDHAVTSYDQRQRKIQEFLRQNGLRERSEIVRLQTAYGSSLSDKRIQALVVSEETEHTAIEINQKRKDLKLPPLEIVRVKMVQSEDHYWISTTRIRNGEIDRQGRKL